MQQKFTELKEQLAQFVEQREALTLVVRRANASDVLYVHQLLASLDQTSTRDVAVVFPFELHDAASYLDEVMRHSDQLIQIGALAIQEGLGEDGATAWEPLPPACHDRQRTPLERIRALLAHVRQYMPNPGNRIVLGLLPPRIHDREEYLRLVGALFPLEGFEPWMAGVRLLVTDEAEEPMLLPWLTEIDAFGVRVIDIDFGHDALTKALVESANDPEAPLNDKLMALMQLAGLDHAYGRHDSAFRTYGVCFTHFQQLGDVTMQGVCLFHTGLLHQHREELELADRRYKQALELALEAESEPLAYQAFVAIGGLEEQRENWGEAVAAWFGAAGIAKKLQNVFGLCDALERYGLCRVALSEEQEALDAWKGAAEAANTGQYVQRELSLYQLLINLHRHRGEQEEADRYEGRLAEVGRRVEEQQQAVADAQRRTGLSIGQGAP